MGPDLPHAITELHCLLHADVPNLQDTCKVKLVINCDLCNNHRNPVTPTHQTKLLPGQAHSCMIVRYRLYNCSSMLQGSLLLLHHTKTMLTCWN
jgi:hypothetical protein